MKNWREVRAAATPEPRTAAELDAMTADEVLAYVEAGGSLADLIRNAGPPPDIGPGPYPVRDVKEILSRAAELAERFADHPADLEDAAGAEALADLHRLVLDHEASEDAVVEAVVRARERGQSWTAIRRRLLA